MHALYFLITARHRYLARVVLSALSLMACLQTRDHCTAAPAKVQAASKSPQTVLAAGQIDSQRLAEAVPPSGSSLFETMSPDRTGIDFVATWIPPKRYSLETTLMLGGGVCIGDYDGDGRPDIFLTRVENGNRLYRNLGDFHFEDVTEQAGVGDDLGMGASFFDIDNDGDLDLYVCRFDRPNRLYINGGDGTFSEQAAQWGLDFNGSSIMMAFADYDADGDLDAYLLTNRLEPPDDLKGKIHWQRNAYGTPYVPKEFAEYKYFFPMPDGGFKYINAAQFDHLYRNNSDGTFTDVSHEAGLEGACYGLGVVWWDYNDDGLPDLYIANDFDAGDQLYRNNGDGTFTNVIRKLIPHMPWFSMGCDTADINNDGRLDLFASDMSGSTHYKQKVSMGSMNEKGWFLEWGEPRQYMRNAVYLNTGTDRFLEVAKLTGLDSTDWTWAVKSGDLDNDGWIDFFVANGMVRDWVNSDFDALVAPLGGPDSEKGKAFWLKQEPKRDENVAFRNMGDLRFEKKGSQWGLNHNGVSFGAAMGDLDGDGDLDLVVPHLDEPVGVYRNGSEGTHRVMLRLVGSSSNRFGLGARVHLETAAGRQTRYLTAARGFMSASEPAVHFGLGEQASIDKLTVKWPSGQIQEFTNLEADWLYTITEPEATGAEVTETNGPQSPESPQISTRPMFAPSNKIRLVLHRETPYDDFARQPLLPNKLSQLGPGIALGDVDGDGDDDFFLGGAAGQMGMLCLNQDGYFAVKSHGPFDRDNPFAVDKSCEDMGVLLLDVDRDGDLDLYVASGGVECESNDDLLRDRLYLNDGQGLFTKAPSESLPDVRDSGSCAVTVDFDRDGDLDIFVGGRVIPGQYPRMPSSRLLRNDSTGSRVLFTDVTDELAPGLREAGMVTSALWSDADGDRWLDLMVTYEWGPVRFFKNVEGNLIDHTELAGLASRLGWWNGIAGGDVDNDGDIDYVVTNFGLNSKYHPSVDDPVFLYYGDFDNQGRSCIVEAKQVGQQLLPVRGKSCSQNAMPFIGDKFPTYHQFAIADLLDIYGTQPLDTALKLRVNDLHSGVYINDGSGNFTFQAFPRIAQASAAFGVVLQDVDGDGNLDCYLAQNFFGPQRETGRLDGGLSMLLLGQGDGTFEPVEPVVSGLVLSEDATGLATTDLNSDGQIDFVVAVNDGELRGYENQLRPSNRSLTVRCDGRVSAIGARVQLSTTDGQSRTAEVYAGGSYLSQSSPVLTFAVPPGAQPKELSVRWSDGKQDRLELQEGQTVVELGQIPGS